MTDTYTAKAWSHSAIPKWLGTRSPNSMNAPASIFCIRLGGTGGIVEPGGSGVVALPRVVASTLTWLRSRPAGVRGGGRGYTTLWRYYGNLSISKCMV